MSDHLEPMRCGNCGCETALPHAQGSSPFYEQVVLECTQCHSRTVLGVERPRINVGWGPGAQGVFCTGWRPSKKDSTR